MTTYEIDARDLARVLNSHNEQVNDIHPKIEVAANRYRIATRKTRAGFAEFINAYTSGVDVEQEVGMLANAIEEAFEAQERLNTLNLDYSLVQKSLLRELREIAMKGKRDE